MKRFENGFTLAETMIVIVVLGVIATLTIPALVNKQRESVARTKVKKAMSAYESALNKMIIENDLKSHETLTAWAGNAENNCANSTNYFKKVQGDGCIFKTSDGIWWNISDIERPLIAFNQDNLTTEKANAENDYSAFVLVGRFGTDGSLRVDDLAYETNHDEDNSKAQVEKLYTLLGLKRSSAGGGNQSPFAACNGADTCVVTYNCPTTDEPNKTCTMNYQKFVNEDNYSYGYDYCAPNDFDIENWICGENDDKWQDGHFEVEKGEFWIAIEGYIDNYDIEAQNLEGSTCTSCSVDYYNAAKRHCELSGGRIAKRSELMLLWDKGKLPSSGWYWYWASGANDPFNAYGVDTDGDTIVYGHEDERGGQVICIGK